MYDLDDDGFAAACEDRLASAFAPQMMMSSDCSWDDHWNRLGGEYFWAVAPHPSDPNAARIAYLPAYYADCGAGAGFGTLFSDPHSGDSEYIIVDVSYLGDESRHWAVEEIFLSAHCGSTFTGGACGWYSWTEFEWADEEPRARPIVWVAVAKHAHYPSLAACNGSIDYCVRDYYVDFPAMAGAARNVGHLSHQLNNCVTARYSDDPSLVDPNAVECLWSTSGRFNGWQGDVWGAPPGPYGDVLRKFGFCDLTTVRVWSRRIGMYLYIEMCEGDL